MKDEGDNFDFMYIVDIPKLYDGWSFRKRHKIKYAHSTPLKVIGGAI